MLDSPVDEIKDRLDIVEVISGYIRLQKSGRNYRANCPFHNEKTPSFMVSPERQIWHCFGCNEGGDIFTFVMKIDGVEFGDALKLLAQRAGVVLKRQDPQLNTQRNKFYEICELATKFFEKQLWESIGGRKMLDYLHDRGLVDEIIKDWRLGYAPATWDGLSDFLINRGYKQKEIFDAGLAAAGGASGDKSWKYCDRFRDRIMFPVCDIGGQPVGFSGRISPLLKNKELAKYINTPQTFIYDKSRLLFGLNKAKTELRRQDACIVVEGNMDVIMSHQAGIKNVVASSGTALAEQQLKIIKRYTNNIIVSFDSDLAGDMATKRGIDLALQNEFDIKVVQLSEKDPADLIKINPESWKEAIGAAKEIIEFYFDSAFKKIGDTTLLGAKEKKQASLLLLPVIKKIKNKVEQAHWLQELASRISIDEKILWEQLNSLSTQLPVVPPKVFFDKKDEVNNFSPLEARLVGLLLIYRQLSPSVDLAEIKTCVFSDDRLAKIAEATIKNEEVVGELGDLKKSLIFQVESRPTDEKDLPAEIDFCFNGLNRQIKKKRLEDLQVQIKKAEKNGDGAGLAPLLEEFNNQSKN